MGFLDELKDKAGAIGDKAKDTLGEVKDKASEVVHEVKEKAEDVVHDVREKFDRHGDEDQATAESDGAATSEDAAGADEAATSEGAGAPTSAAAGESMDTGKEDPGFADQPADDLNGSSEDTDYLQETPADTTDVVADGGATGDPGNLGGTGGLGDSMGGLDNSAGGLDDNAGGLDDNAGGLDDNAGGLDDGTDGLGGPGAAGMTEPEADVVYSTATPTDTEDDTFQQPAAATTENAPAFDAGVASFEDSEGLGADDERPAEDRSSEDPGRQ